MGRETREEKHSRKVAGGDWLSQQRQKRGWTQTDLADRLPDVSQHSISGYERGAFDIDFGIVRDIAKVLGLSEYDTWRGLELPLPAEVATRRRLISYAFRLMNDKDAEDLYEQVIAYVRARRGGAKAGGTQVKTPHVTRPGGSPSLGSQDEESAV